MSDYGFEELPDSDLESHNLQVGDHAYTPLQKDDQAPQAKLVIVTGYPRVFRIRFVFRG